MSPLLSGKIFDIRRFSTHDGDGIRTTVFLKSCPLRCVWCQNPEGISPDSRLLHFHSRCIRCGLCTQTDTSVRLCKDGYPDISGVSSEAFGSLVDVCPAAALAVDCRILTVPEVLGEVSRDEVFFSQGGGVTFSGGEPFAQFPFFLDLLKESKARGLHTAVETSLYTKQENLLKALPYIDLLYADCKVFDEAEHIKLTGVSNKLILDNLAFVLKRKHPSQVVVRTPVIPRFTDSVDNISRIASYLSNLCSDTYYELLNYNPLASAKYVHVDFPYCFTDSPQRFTRSEMESFAQTASDMGLKNVAIG